MKGGSYASDAVVGAVDAAAFGKLTKNFTNAFDQKGGAGKRKNQKKGGADVPEKLEGGKRKNIKKKGGSLASADVLKSTTESSFADLNAKFTNVVPTQKGAAARKNRCRHCGKLLKGGNVTTPTLDSIMANASRVLSGNPTQTSETFAQGLAFKSEPAPVPPSSVIKLLDGLSPGPAPASLKGGFGGQKLKNINDYKQNGSYKVFNRKQLGGDGALKVGLNTNDSIMSSKNTVGVAPIRVPNETTLNIIANEEINAPMLMAKTSHFGDVTGFVESKTNFSYGGAKGKARKPPTAPRKTPVSKSAKKPKGKACA